ncbi:MAG TPA: endonuclease/exonuclease/phosphatase family protein [Dehalococcoidia bacterium]|nr:endonuclease/exonuclease/phosphatase family protein [Dehalococcoidia bacterium]
MTDYSVVFWNVENLFDVEDSPRRSEKLQRTLGNELGGWTSDVLDQKIAQLASIIGQMNRGLGPDLLGVCEVENKYVLELLVRALAVLNRNYQVAHDNTEDNRGIDVAFIYDHDLLKAEDQFSHSIIKRTATRDLFQVNFRTNPGRLLVLVGNHWPSRIGGQYETEPYRIIAGETLAYFHERIRQIHGNDVAVLAMGDFNDEPFNRSLVDYALSEQTRDKVTRGRSPRFLNLMWPILGQGIGTHYYDNTPNVIDQFLVSTGLITGKSGIRVVPDSVQIMRFPEMVKPGSYPVPARFGRKPSLNPEGFSDHYPIGVQLRENG